MRTKFFLTLIGLSMGGQYVFSQLQVTNQGLVGLGTNSPLERLHVANGAGIISNNGRSLRIAPWNTVSIGSNGGIITFWDQNSGWNTIVAGLLQIVSDASLKTEIKEIENPIKLLTDLEGVHFKYKKDSVSSSVYSGTSTENQYSYGFVAQQVNEVIPEIVSDADFGLKSVNYVAVIPILVEGFKVQQKMIESQQQLLDSLKSQLETCCQADSQQYRLINHIEEEDNNSNLPISSFSGIGLLYQNSPNPFKEKTTIKYQIKENYSEASILIFDMQGLLLKRIPIINQLKGEIIIQGSELKPGMYIYTLLVDKKEVDTKRMILLD